MNALPSSLVPSSRVRPLNQGSVLVEREFVVYWITAFHRMKFNYALERAVEWANELKKPLLILETFIVDYPWASDRIHYFFIQGMTDNQAFVQKTKALYYPFVEPDKGARQGLLEAISKKAAVVVTDDFPIFVPKLLANKAGKEFECLAEAVDANGLMPLSLSEKDAPTAYVFRRFLQKNLPEQLLVPPA